jgi:CPA2 family monovalent cation:H+ antiporter-2
MNALGIILLGAAVAYGIAFRFRLPVLPLLVGAGMLLQSSGWLPQGALKEAPPHNEPAAVIWLSLVFLIFATGAELEPRHLFIHRKQVFWITVGQFSGVSLSGFVIARWLGFGALESTYLGLGLAASSTLVVIRQFELRDTHYEPFAQIVSGILLLQDVILILGIVLLARITGGWLGISHAMAAVAVLGMASWLLQRWGVPRMIQWFKPQDELLLLSMFTVLFIFLMLARALGAPPMIGAFAGGFAFSRFPANGVMRGNLLSLAGFFQALFFVALGSWIGVPDGAQWLSALGFSTLLLVVTVPIVSVLGIRNGLSTRTAIESGLILSQTSELSLLLGISGLGLGHLSPEGFKILATTAVISMSLTPFVGRGLVAQALMPLRHPFRRRCNPTLIPRDHVLLLGLGASGMNLVKPLRDQGENVLVVDDDETACQMLKELGVPVLRGDGTDQEILAQVGAQQAKVIVTSMRRVTDSLKVLKQVKGVPVLALVFEDDETEPVRAAGGIPILTSDATAEKFMEWFHSTKLAKG